MLGIHYYESGTITTILNNQLFVFFCRNLKQYLKYGMILKKIHRVATFRQSKWMELFITMTTELRKSAKDDFMKTLAKLIINSGTTLFISSEIFVGQI